jgi:hypothetical protein
MLLSLGIAGDGTAPPAGFALGRNFPNPFNPSTRISYTLPAEAFVNLTVFDALGRKVATLVKGRMAPGTHTAEWRPSSASSGVYFYRIEAGSPDGRARSFVKSGRMMLLR